MDNMKPGIPFEDGTTFGMAGNNPFLVTGSDEVWHITAGNLDIFAVGMAGKEPAGRRHHIFRITSGTILFGINQKREGYNYGLLAVGGHGTVVTRLTLKRFMELATSDFRQELTQAVDVWVKTLSAAMSSFSPHTPEGLILPTDKSVAVTCPAASIENDRFLVVPDGQDFPISLEDFHSLFLDYLKEKINIETTKERDHLRQKQKIDRLAIESALSKLAGTMDGKDRRASVPAADEDMLLAACRLVAHHMGITVRAPFHRSGGQANTLHDIARTSRFRVRSIALRGNWWLEDNGPILAFKGEDEKPISLIPDASLHYQVVDPGNKSKTPLTKGNATEILPFGYIFYPPFPERALKALDLLKIGLKNCLPRDIVMIGLMGIAVGLLGVITPVATGVIFDTIIPGAQKTQLIHLALVLLVIAFSTSLFQLTRNLAVFRVETRMGLSVEAGVWDRLLSLPVPFFHRFLAGDLALRSMGIEEIRQMLSSTTVSSILSAIFMVFNLVLLFYYEWRLALVAIGLVTIAVAATTLTGMLEIKYERIIQQLEGRISGMVFQLVTGIAKLRLAAAEERAFASWAKHFSEKKRYDYKARSISNGLTVFNSAFPLLISTIVFAGAAWIISNGITGEGSFSTGKFLAFNAAFGQFLATGLQTGSILISILQIIPIYERAKPIMDATPEVDHSKADPGELRGDILISHLSFRYQPTSPLVLDNVTIQIRHGEFVAIVGPSGAGKSSILRLLLGFEVPESGSIHFDGQDYSTIDVQNVRRQMGVVLQNGQVMPGNILQNIVGSSPLTLDDAWDAARMAGFDKDIERMPMGMFTVVSEGGSTFSGGQKQRLLIARAIVNRPKILFFDEATSALDNKTQAEVSESLNQLKVTRVVIAHRLSTIINADIIYVLEKGRVVQAGSYKELVTKEGLFAELAKRQIV